LDRLDRMYELNKQLYEYDIDPPTMYQPSRYRPQQQQQQQQQRIPTIPGPNSNFNSRSIPKPLLHSTQKHDLSTTTSSSSSLSWFSWSWFSWLSNIVWIWISWPWTWTLSKQKQNQNIEPNQQTDQPNPKVPIVYTDKYPLLTSTSVPNQTSELVPIPKCIVLESTPLGNVVMYYNESRESFEYYSTATIPYAILETIARKWIRQTGYTHTHLYIVSAHEQEQCKQNPKYAKRANRFTHLGSLSNWSPLLTTPYRTLGLGLGRRNPRQIAPPSTSTSTSSTSSTSESTPPLPTKQPKKPWSWVQYKQMQNESKQKKRSDDDGMGGEIYLSD